MGSRFGGTARAGTFPTTLALMTRYLLGLTLPKTRGTRMTTLFSLHLDRAL